VFGPVERAPFVACASAHSRSVGEWEWDEVSVLLLHQEKPESAPMHFQALGWYKIAWNPTVPFEGLTIASIVDSQR